MSESEWKPLDYQIVSGNGKEVTIRVDNWPGRDNVRIETNVKMPGIECVQVGDLVVCSRTDYSFVVINVSDKTLLAVQVGDWGKGLIQQGTTFSRIVRDGIQVYPSTRS